MTAALNRRHIHRGRVIDVGTEVVTLPTGATVTLDVILHPGAALVVPIDDNRITLIRQYRHCAQGYLWEAPAGTLNAGETPEACARRELTEEAGRVAGTLHHVGFIFTAPGFCNEKIHIFIATQTTAAATQRDEDEVIVDVQTFSYARCEQMVASGEIVDAKTIAGLMHARRFVV